MIKGADCLSTFFSFSYSVSIFLFLPVKWSVEMQFKGLRVVLSEHRVFWGYFFCRVVIYYCCQLNSGLIGVPNQNNLKEATQVSACQFKSWVGEGRFTRIMTAVFIFFLLHSVAGERTNCATLDLYLLEWPTSYPVRLLL